MSPAANRTLGPYELLESIGSGAVGDVYRARDPRLGRDVAIKVLNRNVAGGLTRQARFEQEARAVSALNHPNILTVYDVGYDGANPYIVSEFLDGEPLRKLIERGPVPFKRLLDIAIQIADGLAAAHDAGIVHRDLKPENIMITRSGRVKILDFGLAKPILEGGAEETLSNEATAPGLLIGTAAYMSPEQARGSSSLTAWSDQFSFGLVLYEMASGEQAFRRPSPLETLSAILTEHAPEVPVGPFPFKWLVMRCLHKQPDHRYASTADLVRELRTIRDSLTASWDTGPVVPAEPAPAEVAHTNQQPSRQFHLTQLVWALLLLAAGAAGFAAARLTVQEPPFALAKQQFTPYAAGAGFAGMPAWSPRGRALAWSGESAGGVLQIFMRTNSGAQPSQLTHSTEDCTAPFWSADGSRVYYLSAGALWTAGVAGGSPQKVIDRVRDATLSPDGRRLALLRGEHGRVSVWTAGADGSQPRPYVGAPASLPGGYVRWRPDGGALGFWTRDGNGRAAFWILPWPEAAPRRAFDSDTAHPFTWMQDGERIVYGDGDLVMRDTDGGAERRITASLQNLSWPAAAPDGRRIAFAASTLQPQILRVPLAGGDPQQLAAGRSAVVSRSGEMAWVASADGRPEIRIRYAGGGERRLIGADQFDSPAESFAGLAFAPDGTRIAFARRGADGEAIWISSLSGENPVRLTAAGVAESQPAWSPDSTRLVYVSSGSGVPELLIARVGSVAAPHVLARGEYAQPRWSPAGDSVAAIGEDGSVVIFSTNGGNTARVAGGPFVALEWSRDGATLHALRRSGRTLELATIDVPAASVTTVRTVGPWPAEFAAATEASLSSAGDAASVIVSLLRSDADVWVLSER